jgi:D-beta-D-heptose 7-phosphate kinase/D-beta-D-heptose 1-phosphate adenosyltransferase
MNKIFSQKDLIKELKKEKYKNKKIVFTNGCFDILHVGHVSYLEKAKKKGDLLVVALDTDKAVKKLKGKDRPINDLKSRQIVISALESVDFVTSFDNADPLPLIKKIRPHILVKGGDWKVEQIRGAKEVLGWGGKVYSLPYVKDKSTTNIIKKIKSL